jgi:hypothetical protein
MATEYTQKALDALEAARRNAQTPADENRLAVGEAIVYALLDLARATRQQSR